ncbi:MAG: type VI secretion system ATPase TssH, partial [Actinobacteria bacterium]|nr:type VI secretion system ATPase TssH [Actinomycetota bacterium]
MQFDRFTLKSQEALSAARNIASENGHQSIEDIHMMSAMLDQKEGIIIPVLQKLEVDPDDFRTKVDILIKNTPKVTGGASQIYISSDLNSILDDSFKEAHQLKDEYISTEHILISIAQSRGEPGELLKQYGVTKDRIYQVLMEIRGNQRVTDQNPEDKYQALQKFGKDITSLARKGKLDPVIGRDDEIRRVIQV